MSHMKQPPTCTVSRTDNRSIPAGLALWLRGTQEETEQLQQHPQRAFRVFLCSDLPLLARLQPSLPILSSS